MAAPKTKFTQEEIDEPRKERRIRYTKVQQAKIDTLQEAYDAAQEHYAAAIREHNETDPAHPAITAASSHMRAIRAKLMEFKATQGLRQVFPPATQPIGGTVTAGEDDDGKEIEED